MSGLNQGRDRGGTDGRGSRRQFLAGSGMVLAAASSVGLPRPAKATMSVRGRYGGPYRARAAHRARDRATAPGTAQLCCDPGRRPRVRRPRPVRPGAHPNTEPGPPRGRRGSVHRFLRGRADLYLLFLSPNLPHAPHEAPSLGSYGPRRWTYGNKAHAAQITLLDTYVGRIVRKLHELGLDENTIVFFAGDNGPHGEGGRGYDPRFLDSSGGLRGLKRNLYEGGIRVPMIAWSPGILGRKAGTVSDHVWALWDLYPTLADFAGAPTPGDLDGVSARDALLGRSGGADRKDRHLYWFRLDGARFPLANAADRGRWRRLAEAVRQGHWKALRFAPGRDPYLPGGVWDMELYDLRDDPGETTNVAREHPDVVKAMVRLMRSSWEEPPTPRDSWSPEGLSVDPPRFLVAGEAGRVTTVFTNSGDGARRRVRLGLAAPAGWTVEPLSSATFPIVEPGRSGRTV